MKDLVVWLHVLFLAMESFAVELHKVQTPSGTYEGFIENVHFDGTEYTVKKYLGIPYAEAPTGILRFRKPVPKNPHKATYRATSLKEICVQRDSGSLPSDKFNESENCLFLNIYAPHKMPRRISVPVLVYIHGGYGRYTFVNGAANFVSGDVFSAVGDVIVVTFNYRLSLLGFFSMENDAVKGNYGLWDQHEAIKWVHRNIADFGGDPSKITLFGEGQGAVSAILHTFYPGNLGLVHKVIAEKGTPFPALREGLSPFISYTYPVIKTAMRLGCFHEDVSLIANCMMNISTSRLKNFVESDFDLEAVSPTIDGEFILGPAENMVAFEDDMMIGFEDIGDAKFLNLESDHNAIIDYDFDVTNTHSSFIHNMIVAIYGYGIPTFTEQIIINRYTDLNDSPKENMKYQEKMTNDVLAFIPSIRTYEAYKNMSYYSDIILYKLSSKTAEFDGGNMLDADSKLTVQDRFYKFGFSKDMLALHNMSTFNPSRSDWQISRKMIEFYAGFVANKKTSVSGYPPDRTNPKNDSDITGIPCVVLPSGDVIDYRSDPSAVFWLDIVPRLLELTRSTSHMDHVGGHRFKPPDSEDQGGERDISKEGANAVIIALGVITGLLCLCLILMGVFVLVVKIRRAKVRSNSGRQ